MADTLDSFRVRNLIDSKKDIIDSEIYTENEYYDILFKMFSIERLKYELFEFLKQKQNNDINDLKEFSNRSSIDLKRCYSLLFLLKNENLILIEELYDKHNEQNNINNKKEILRDIKIKVINNDFSKVKSIYEPVKVIFDSKNCSGCGLCAGICPIGCLNIFNGFGEIDEEKCIRCGLCYYFCPRSYLPVNVLNMYQESNSSEFKNYSNIGHFIEIYSAKTKIKELLEVCQDGGISSTCLYYLLDNKKIDYALGVKISNIPWQPEPFIISCKKDIIDAAGTKYVNNPNLQIINQKRLRNKKLAVVGVPCQMQALLKSRIYFEGFPPLNNVEYRIGIFCMESFSYQSILKICEILNVDIKNVKKMNINKGKFFVFTKNGEEFNVPIKEISHLAREDCEVCFDLTSESADISIGSIGAQPNWNIVIIRTLKGKELYQNLISNDLIESKPIDDVKPGLPLLQKIAGIKKKTCAKNISKKLNDKNRIPYYS
ncbi:MAG: Coenzyme F420 hydrogenase/dehydrogenase, beta subunit C-terminal domain [Promethearchaeota archaeon]